MQRATVLQKEHEGFRKILAGIGGGVIGDEFIQQVAVEEIQLAFGTSATFFTRLVLRVLLQDLSPLGIRGWIAIGIGSPEST